MGITIFRDPGKLGMDPAVNTCNKTRTAERAFSGNFFKWEVRTSRNSKAGTHT